jgi:hypothetical protein
MLFCVCDEKRKAFELRGEVHRQRMSCGIVRRIHCSMVESRVEGIQKGERYE